MDEEQYLQRNISACSMDEDELEGEMNLSDDESNVQQRVQIKSMRKKERKQLGRKKNKYQVEVDTNIFEIGLDCLKKNAEMATGDAEFCEGCKAVFNMKSVLTVQNDQQVWKCEFCNHENKVMLDEEEKPKTDEVTYLLEAASQVESKKMAGQDISVVFCLDVSGSMCVTEPIKGKHTIKGDRRQRDLAAFAQFGDGSDQFINQADKGVTYVSRLQCVQAAVQAQIEQMQNGAQNRKVGVVTFNNEVTLIGDGSQVPQTITGDKLMNFDWLQKNGSEKAELYMGKTVKDTGSNLQDKVMGIEETGPTALGPAVLTSVALAAEGKPGSTVVICTDGLANVGLGAFDEAKDEAQIAKVKEFYERVGQYAKSKGVTVNLVSIKGDECNIDALSTLQDLTGGNIERVDPVNLTQNFASMLSKPVIATSVVCKIKLHKGLQFRNELVEYLSHNNTQLTKDMGSVTEENVFTFEYTIKSIEQLLELDDVDMTQIKELPF
jgi:hypothetical protein